MPKTLKESPTKDNLMQAAQKLMMEKGFVATSVDEICEEAKVTKGSFFHYFKSKEELGKELVNRYSENMCCSMDASVSKAGSDPLDRVLGWVDCALEMSKSPNTKGCLIGTFTQELYESHPEIRDVCAKSLETIREHFEKDLAAAKKKYIPQKQIDLKGLSETFFATLQGSMILIKANQDRNLMKRTLSHYRAYLKQLFQ